jgi:hypothetical protein
LRFRCRVLSAIGLALKQDALICAPISGLPEIGFFNPRIEKVRSARLLPASALHHWALFRRDQP